MFRAVLTLTAALFFQALAAQSFTDFSSRSSVDPLLKPFYHGVASGDPSSDGIILWTRVTPDSTGPVNVEWRISEDLSFTSIVQSGIVSTDESADYTVQIEVSGLNSNSWYYYEFETGGQRSVVGRTRTTPVGGIDSLRFALVSCSNYQAGYFTAYNRIAERNDVDAVIHLGDYIYEYETGGYGFDASLGREHDPDTEIISLSDYRLRHNWYKLDPDLRKIHQYYPFITIWDDHEFADNAYKDGAGNHQLSEGPWEDRESAAIQAYLEWMPIRRDDPSDSGRVYRSIEYGDLVEFIVLDTRIEGRDLQAASVFSGILDDTSRHLISSDQMQWLKDRLTNSNARWKVVVNQVMMAPLEAFGVPVNTDQWDGYQADREEIYDHIREDSIRNFVVLTGDIHTSWAMDLPATDFYDPSTGNGSAGVEFVCTSVTSPGFPIGFGTSLIQLFNEHIRYIDLTEHGYQVLDLNHTRTQSDYYFVNSITDPNSLDYLATSYYVINNQKRLRATTDASVRLNPNPAVPPAYPRTDCPIPLNPTTSSIGTNNATISWDPVLEASNYVVEGKLVASSIVKSKLTPFSSNTINAFSPATSYSWRVASACDTLGSSAFTEWQDFTTTTLRENNAPLNWPGNEAGSGLTLLAVYPNPFVDRFGFQIALQHTSELNWQLLDMQGRVVAENSLGELQRGVYFFEAAATDVISGNYLLQINTADQSIVRQIQKVDLD